jgi:hypothetical protein
MRARRGVSRQAAELSDFDRLLGPSSRADVAGSGTALPAPAVVDFSEQPTPPARRAHPLDWVALVVAIVAPPLGLVVALILRTVRRGDPRWSARIAKTSIAVGLVLTMLLAAAAAWAWLEHGRDREAAAIAAEARPLCAALAAEPTMLRLPAYGWPTETAPLPDTLAAMDDYRQRWSELASIAPTTIAARVEAIADRAAGLVATTESTLTIDRDGNLQAMTAVTDAAALPAWIDTHCE